MKNLEECDSQLRTYHRRNTTRTSGYHVCDEYTGGECIIKKSQRLYLHGGKISLNFSLSNLDLVRLFNKDLAIIAFGGYIYADSQLKLELRLQVNNQNPIFSSEVLMDDKIIYDWEPIGLHQCVDTSMVDKIKSAAVEMSIESCEATYVDFISFDFNVVSYQDFIPSTFEKSFFQKTSLCVPMIYYLDTLKDIESLCDSPIKFLPGQNVVLKSCNRCGRFIPINVNNELHRLGFTLHCKKNPPCTHSKFRSYVIENYDQLDSEVVNEFNIEKQTLISYHGHQLECRACKKFYVNTPLNPQRDTQQHREDSIRRRAIEVLVNNLLRKNTIHNEFKSKGLEFVPYMLDKFDHKCFKCGCQIDENNMDLDHTMPLAYLYRLDETATCLCKDCNSQKHDHFPCDFYTKSELKSLSEKTGISLDNLNKREVNPEVLKLLVKNIVWFFNDFLMNPDYQKIRKGILTADKIYNSLQKVIGSEVDLLEEYYKVTGTYPSSINCL